MEGVALDVPLSSAIASTFASSSSSVSPPPFLSKTYDMVNDPATDLVVSWNKGNNSFVVWNVPEFARDLLPKYFKHNNFSSFVRQLNTYGFRKIDPDRWEFANEGFLKGQKHLLKSINRRKPAHAHSHQQPPIQSMSAKSCVEIGSFGMEEEVERLKRDKNVLMQELVRLRQHQQATDNQLQSVGQRVQTMEQRQQQMMSFLAKAMQSPGFLAQVVQQENDNTRHITGINKKRRLPKNEEDGFGVGSTVTSDGKMIKFQPLITEAAKSMLKQILKLNTSPRRDQPISDPNAFLIDGIPPPSALESGSSAQTSGVTLAEVLPTSRLPNLPAETAMSVNHPSNTSPDILLSHMANNANKAVGSAVTFPGINIQNSEQRMKLPDVNHVSRAILESTPAIPNMTFAGNETVSSSVIDLVQPVADGTLPIGEEFSPVLEMDALLDDISKFSGSNDVFWEQIFTSTSLPEDNEEVNSNISEGGASKEQRLKIDQPVGWDKAHHMDNLTEQMGLLTAELERVDAVTKCK